MSRFSFSISQSGLVWLFCQGTLFKVFVICISSNLRVRYRLFYLFFFFLTPWHFVLNTSPHPIFFIFYFFPFLCHRCSNTRSLSPCARPGIELVLPQSQALLLTICTTEGTPTWSFLHCRKLCSFVWESRKEDRKCSPTSLLCLIFVLSS